MFIQSWCKPSFDIQFMEKGKYVIKRWNKKSSKFLESPRNRFHLPRSPRNDKLQFLDSSIPRGMKSSEELPSLSYFYIYQFGLYLWKWLLTNLTNHFQIVVKTCWITATPQNSSRNLKLHNRDYPTKHIIRLFVWFAHSSTCPQV